MDSLPGTPLDATDPIDSIALAWLRERPGTPVDGIPVISRVLRLARLFGEDRRRVLAAAGADWATLDLLSVLRRAGPPYRLSTRQLTERTLVTAGAISQRITRAERDGLVERHRATDGSRTVWVTLTVAGHALDERLVDHVLLREAELVGLLSDDQRTALVEQLRLLLDLVETHLEQDAAPRVDTGGE